MDTVPTREFLMSRRRWLDVVVAALGADGGRPASSHAGQAPRAAPFTVGPFRRVYVPGPQVTTDRPPPVWHLNDHCFGAGRTASGTCSGSPGLTPA